ncbi:type IV pilin [Methanoculleus bourgensis]|uniref:type IV pilin n=1 Tax=Methanoculleus bourgensis TaxID=83986 RepID=UPI003B95B216
MMKFRENEDAVSPVIGVILMVAITVILAAVIAAFVFGMGSNVQTTKTVGVTANLDKDRYLVVTLQGGGDVADLLSLNMTVNGGEEVMINTTTTKFMDRNNLTVGASFNTSKPIESGQHIVVVAHFKDYSQQVVLDKFY